MPASPQPTGRQARVRSRPGVGLPNVGARRAHLPSAAPFSVRKACSFSIRFARSSCSANSLASCACPNCSRLSSRSSLELSTRSSTFASATRASAFLIFRREPSVASVSRAPAPLVSASVPYQLPSSSRRVGSGTGSLEQRFVGFRGENTSALRRLFARYRGLSSLSSGSRSIALASSSSVGNFICSVAARRMRRSVVRRQRRGPSGPRSQPERGSLRVPGRL
jgi:hypothetical protein